MRVIKRLKWDSECFGYEVGMVSLGNDALNYSKFVQAAGAYRLIYIFSSNHLTHLPSNIKKVDEKITLKKALQPCALSDSRRREPAVKDGSIVSFDVIEGIGLPQDDLERSLLDLALISGEYSRFKIDRRLNNQEFEKLYQLWVRKALMEDDKGMAFVKDGQVLGMITWTFDQTEALKISLLAVHPSSRNQGIGRVLIDKALKTGTDSGSRALWVTTQRANIAAMALYQKAGFEAVKTSNVYHWWKG